VISVNSEAKQGAISVNMERQRGEGGIDLCE
jgi:hypothetical protein